ncbi:MAG: NUDIX pyrophosphatase [Chloroflexi bacterium]|nr:MAG: NUDIX pyrophosphatase [Chloroflexota bacterium]
MRVPFQVLILPYRWKGEEPEYLVLKVKDGGYWQFVAGGGEDEETPLEAALRECREETSLEGDLFQLDSLATIPKTHFLSADTWDKEIYVIPEYAFALEVLDGRVQLSREHTESRWVSFQEGSRCLRWDSNRNALWELEQRLTSED